MSPGKVKLIMFRLTMDILDLDGLVIRAGPGNGVMVELSTGSVLHAIHSLAPLSPLEASLLCDTYPVGFIMPFAQLFRGCFTSPKGIPTPFRQTLGRLPTLLFPTPFFKNHTNKAKMQSGPGIGTGR